MQISSILKSPIVRNGMIGSVLGGGLAGATWNIGMPQSMKMSPKASIPLGMGAGAVGNIGFNLLAKRMKW